MHRFRVSSTSRSRLTTRVCGSVGHPGKAKRQPPSRHRRSQQARRWPRPAVGLTAPRFGCNCPKCPSGNPTYYPVKSNIYLLSGLGGLSDLAVPEPVWAAVLSALKGKKLRQYHAVFDQNNRPPVALEVRLTTPLPRHSFRPPLSKPAASKTRPPMRSSLPQAVEIRPPPPPGQWTAPDCFSLVGIAL